MFSFTTIAHYQEALKTGSTSCQEAVVHYLQQIKKNRHLNAFTEVYEAEAQEKAMALDTRRKAGHPTGKLHGVIVSIKDVLCYEGHAVTAASHILKEYMAVYNATAVQWLLDEEAIIIGSCNCDEFAMGSTNENSAYGKVLNAQDETRVPGGSSGGSAVSVQAGMSMISLGTDTGGSVRQPADFCGIIGLKPTYGRISRYGLIAYASSFDQIGIFSNTVEDAALVLEVIAKTDDFDSTVKQQQQDVFTEKKTAHPTYRIAYFEEALQHSSLDAEIRHAIYHLIEALKAAGHVVEPVKFELLDYIVPAYYVLTTAEASSNLSRFDGVRYGHRTQQPVKDLTDFYKKTRSEGFGKEVQKRILLGTFVLSSGYYDAYFSKAQQVRRMLVNKTAEIFNSYDLILTPTSPTTALKIGEKSDDPIALYLADIYTVFANLTGLPGISVPLFKHRNGLPFGIQVMTGKWQEAHLLQFADLLMQQYQAKKNE